MSKPKLDSKAAKELLLKEQEENRKACMKKIQAALDEHNMQLRAQAVVAANEVSIVPKSNN